MPLCGFVVHGGVTPKPRIMLSGTGRTGWQAGGLVPAPLTATSVENGFEVATWTLAETVPDAVGEKLTEKPRTPLGPIVAGRDEALTTGECALSGRIAFN